MKILDSIIINIRLNFGILMPQVLWEQLPATAANQEVLGPREYHQPLPQRREHRTGMLRWRGLTGWYCISKKCEDASSEKAKRLTNIRVHYSMYEIRVHRLREIQVLNRISESVAQDFPHFTLLSFSPQVNGVQDEVLLGRLADGGMLISHSRYSTHRSSHSISYCQYCHFAHF